jgi:small subunit ribosomal protein S2
MKQLLEAGTHFGHQKKRWNPKMKRFIFTDRGDVHVIDLQQTVVLIENAYNFIKEAVKKGGKVLFVGTKKQAQDVVSEEAQRAETFYVNQRWLGGLLTNYKTIKKNLARMENLEKLLTDEEKSGKLTKSEIARIKRELRKYNISLSGIRKMSSLPQVIFIVDSKREETAIKEANRLGIPIVAIVDTNGDPDLVTYPIPANDDAIRSIKLLCQIMADAVIAGRSEQVETAIVPEIIHEVPEEIVPIVAEVKAVIKPREEVFEEEIIELDLGEDE